MRSSPWWWSTTFVNENQLMLRCLEPLVIFGLWSSIQPFYASVRRSSSAYVSVHVLECLSLWEPNWVVSGLGEGIFARSSLWEILWAEDDACLFFFSVDVCWSEENGGGENTHARAVLFAVALWWPGALKAQWLAHNLLGEFVELLPVLAPHFGSIDVCSAFVIWLC